MMLLDLLVALALIAILAAAFASLQRKRRRKRMEERSHELYLRTKKRDWLAKWRRQSKVKRLTYHAGETDLTPEVGEHQ